MSVRDAYHSAYTIRENLSDYLEGPRSLREAERHISDALPMLDGLLQLLTQELRGHDVDPAD